jgi:hypothetical protein
VCVGSPRSIVGRVRLDGKRYEPQVGAPRVNVWATRQGDWQAPSSFPIWKSAHLDTRRDTLLADDGTFRIEQLVPGDYVVHVRGADIERMTKATVTANEDADVTIDAKRIQKDAEVTIHGLDRGFDDYLFVRVDDGSPLVS